MASLVALSLFLVISGLSWGSSGSGAPTAERDPLLASQTQHFRFFSPSSFWNTQVPANAVLDPNSASLVAALASTVSAERQSKQGPWISTTSYSVPIYRVSADQPTLRVRLVGGGGDQSLRSA
jgi:hypothetical protein